MSCKDTQKFRTSEASTKAAMRTQGAIDGFLNILDLGLFRTLNGKWSRDAKERFNVQGMLFSEEDNGRVAKPNKQAFKQIDNAKGIYYQEGAIGQSVADDQTLANVKKAIDQMGISLMTLAEYAKNSDISTTSINGLADLTKNIIAIAEGKEAEALTEEMVHIATAILEQVDPRLVTEMISKIDRFKIYKQVYEQYKNNPKYQLENGKPNIRKIKKEAVDKLIAEVIINNSSDIEQFPELQAEENVSLMRRFWNAILDLFRRQYKNSDISIFEKAAGKIMEGIGTVDQIQGEGVH